MTASRPSLASFALGCCLVLASAADDSRAAPDQSPRRAPLRAAAATVAVPDYSENWRDFAWPSVYKFNGFHPVDIDGDGDLEFVFGVADFSWGIAEYDPVGRRYEMTYRSAVYPVAADQIRVLRVVTVSGVNHLWIGYESGTVEVIDLVTRSLVTSITVSSASKPVFDIAVVDANNDGQTDVAVLAEDVFTLYAPDASELRISVSHPPATRFAVGNIDSDPLVEVVLNSGRILRMIGTNPPAVRDVNMWLGNYIGLADLDADGRAELIGQVSEFGAQHVRAYDLESVTPAMKWSRQIFAPIAPMQLVDVQGSALPEVLLMDHPISALRALDITSGSQLWEIGNSDNGASNFAVFDADADGQREVMFGTGYDGASPAHLEVFDLATRTHEFRSVDKSGPYSVDIGDVDGDGRLEIVTLSTHTDAWWYSGTLSIYDAETHALEWQSDGRLFDSGLGKTYAMRVADIRGDARPEIIVGGERSSFGMVFVFDPVTHTVQDTWFVQDGSPVRALDVADIAADGDRDIELTNSDGGSVFPGYKLTALDPVTGDISWSTGLAGATARSMVQAADAGAAGPDLVVANGFVTRVRLSDKAHVTSAASNYRAVAVVNVDGAGGAEVVAGRADGLADVLDGDTLVVRETLAICAGSGIAAVTGLGDGTVAFACPNALVVHDLASGQSSSAPMNTFNAGLGGAMRSFMLGGTSFVLVGGSEALSFSSRVNRAPVIPAGSITMHWRGSADYAVNATDPDGDALIYTIVAAPTRGTASWQTGAQGVLRYVANRTSTGTDAVDVRVSDGSVATMRTIPVTLTNAAPTATTSALSFHWRGTQTARLALADSNDDPVTLRIGTAPARGALGVTDAATGDVQFTPSSAFVGADTLTYDVYDGADASALRTVQLTLTNTAPGAPASIARDVTLGTTVVATLAAADANGDPLTYVVTAQPSRGTLTLNATTGQFEYVGAAGTGNVTASVVASDGVSQSAAATLTFRYADPPAGGASSSSSSSGGGKKGGSLDVLTLLATLGCLVLSMRARRRSSN